MNEIIMLLISAAEKLEKLALHKEADDIMHVVNALKNKQAPLSRELIEEQLINLNSLAAPMHYKVIFHYGPAIRKFQVFHSFDPNFPFRDGSPVMDPDSHIFKGPQVMGTYGQIEEWLGNQYLKA